MNIYHSYTELFGRKDLDFVINASYSDLHYPVTKDLLEHGFNVLCEKPLCKTPEMVQDLIDTARKNFLDSETPEPVLDHRSLHKEDGSPCYCDNHIVWHEETIPLDADVWNSFTKCSSRFYHAFYDHLVNGAELFMKPDYVL